MAIERQAALGEPLQRLDGLPPEIAFLADRGIPADLLRHAAATAARVGVTPDQVVLKHGLVGEDEFYRALADELGVAFVARPLLSPHAQFPHSILAELTPGLGPGAFIGAPSGPGLRRLLMHRRTLPRSYAITTPSALREAVFAAQRTAIAHHGAHDLPDRMPMLSSRSGASPVQIVATLLALAALALACTVAPTSLHAAVSAGLYLLFLAMVLMRLSTALEAGGDENPWTRRVDDRALPVYTVIAPLYRERRVAARLVRALAALDYPAAKLDIKLVLEEDDTETAAALAAIELPGFVEIVVAPSGLPKTKPRALNVALPLARGQFTVVYDAEDVPEPDQLRKAVALFRVKPPHVACLQARLTIDNADDTWLTRLFAIEYACLFDVINPGLAASGMPMPLGGTSNHFRTDVLRQVGGWDAWNVTEDADLGIRLARFGYRTADLPSSTFEEAPQTLRAWMNQRTRWLKGFLQTCITHSREPLTIWRQLGPVRLAGAVTMTFGAVVSVMVYPVFTALLVAAIATGRLFGSDSLLLAIADYLSICLFVLGLAAMIVPAFLGLKRRRLRSLLPWALLLPLYYGLVCAAAWRSVWELARQPHRWNKTDHGWARTSRSLTAASAAPGPPPLGPVEREVETNRSSRSNEGPCSTVV